MWALCSVFPCGVSCSRADAAGQKLPPAEAAFSSLFVHKRPVLAGASRERGAFSRRRSLRARRRGLIFAEALPGRAFSGLRSAPVPSRGAGRRAEGRPGAAQRGKRAPGGPFRHGFAEKLRELFRCAAGRRAFIAVGRLRVAFTEDMF